MLVERCISLESRSEWNEALIGIKHGFAHTWENCYAMHLTTGFPTYLYCIEIEGTRIVCPISERSIAGYTDIVTPYGFSGFVGNGDCPEFPHHWQQFVRRRGYVCGYVSLHPVFENSSYYRFEEVYQPNSLYVLDLRPSIDDILKNLDRNRKRELKDWGARVDALIFDKAVLTEFFLANYQEFVRSANFPMASYFSKDTLEFLCGLDNIFMVGAGVPGNIKAVYIFSHTEDAGDCLFYLPRPEGREYTTPLLWCGLNYLKSIGIPIMMLGGGVRENDNIAQSKQRWGSQKVPFRCLKQVYRPEAYEALCKQAHTDPGDMLGYFPSYRKA